MSKRPRRDANLNALGKESFVSQRGIEKLVRIIREEGVRDPVQEPQSPCLNGHALWDHSQAH